MNTQHQTVAGSTNIKLVGLSGKDTLISYMDHKKFEKFLANGLKLARTDKFAKDDHFEGEYTEQIYTLFAAMTITHPNGNSENGIESIKADCERVREHAFASCWTLSENENVALWRLYGKDKDSVAIKTSAGKLKQEIERHIRDATESPSNMFKFFDKKMVKIKYIDHRRCDISAELLSKPAEELLHYKNVGFEYEGEVRIIFNTSNHLERGTTESRFSDEIVLKIRLKDFIDEILVCPCASDDYFKKVQNISKKHEINHKVKWSDLKYVPGHSYI